MSNFLATLLIVLISSSKYSAGMGIALLSNQSVIIPYLANIIGGLIGIVVFIYFGNILTMQLSKFFKLNRRKFTRKNRFLVRIRTMGLTSVAFLTPVFLSIPLGIVISLSLTSDKKKIFLAMMISCIFWTTLFFFLYKTLGLDLDKYLIIEF